jgi:hypothetical protein
MAAAMHSTTPVVTQPLQIGSALIAHVHTDPPGYTFAPENSTRKTVCKCAAS